MTKGKAKKGTNKNFFLSKKCRYSPSCPIFLYDYCAAISFGHFTFNNIQIVL
jgi:hypothetical protein